MNGCTGNGCTGNGNGCIGATLAKKALIEDAIQFSENIGVVADGHGGYLGADIATFACAKVMEALSYNQAVMFNHDVS